MTTADLSSQGAILGPLGALLSSATWALGTAYYSRLSHSNSAFAINTTRALVALPCFILAVLGVSLVSGHGLAGGVDAFARVPMRTVVWCAISMTCSYGIGDSLFFWGARTLGVPSALAIASSYPLWTAWFGWQFRGEQLTVLQGLGLLLTVVGMAAVILLGARARRGSMVHHHHGPHARRDFWMALTAALGASAFWAINSFAVAQAGRGAGPGESVDPLTGNAVRMVFAVAISFLLGRIWARKRPAVVSRAQVWSVGWVFVIEGFLGSLFFMYGLAHSPLAIGATLASIAPILALPVAWAMGLEKVSWARSLAVALTVVGLCLLVGAGLS